ncbi:hypothetical protein CL619_01775 [archaeon]|nr:hypothetical protein [archaeon]|tara:strand:+ start:2255 stop:2941 length:687 start_codon:yes stop_codon:yes gene_type:complete
MEEHKILTGMLLVALVVSVVGTVITVDRLGSVGGVGITGAAGGTGDLNITQDITITLPDSAIDFGNGKVDPTASFALADSAPGVSTVSGTWENISDNITVRNDGNTGINLTVSSNRKAGNDTTLSFICQGETDGECANDVTFSGLDSAVSFAYGIVNNEANSCGNDLQSVYNTIASNGVNYNVCGCLKSGNVEDEVALYLEVGIPDDAQGQKSATLTFTSSVAGDGGC